MDGPAIKFGQFTVTQLLDHFFVSAAPPSIESQALRYMFAVFSNELPKSSNKAAHSSTANDAAIDKIEFRFDLLKEHAESFFPRKYKPDMKALTLAVICDEYIVDAAPPEDEEYDGTSPLHGYLDHATVRRAITIWEEASAIEGHGISADTPVTWEALFLAHINAMENLRGLERDYDEYTPDELLHTLQKDLAAIPGFAVWDLALGQILLECYDDMNDHITQANLAVAPAPAEKPKPALRLVADNDPAP